MNDKWHHITYQLDSVINFLKEHETIMHSHLNDFFINEDAGHQIDNPSFYDICCSMAFLSCCFESTYGYSCHTYCPRNIRLSPCNDIALNKNVNTFLSLKKDHEINIMSSCVMAMVSQTGCRNVVDIGSGKGYLGQRLTQNCDCHILGIEGSSSCSESALNRQKQMGKLKTSLNKLNDSFEGRDNMTTITHEISNTTTNDPASFLNLIKANFSKNDDVDGDGSSLLIGLHACGDLTAHTVRLFAKEKYFRGMQIVGCCYNLCSERLPTNEFVTKSSAEQACFPLSSYVRSKNIHLGQIARQLACQSPEKWQAMEQNLQPSLLYRAILQKMAFDLKTDSTVLSKVKFRNIGKRSSSFPDYLSRVYRYLDPKEVDTIAAVAEEYHGRYAERWEEMKSFHWHRMQLAPCIEKLILLDRLCYLLECGFANASVVKMFDTSLSPRCYAIVCEKDE